MQTGKTKKKVKRLIAFLLCVIMVLGVGTQEIIGRDVFVVNAEEPEGGSGETAPEEEPPAEEEPPSEPEPQAEEPSEPLEETIPEETTPEAPPETPEETIQSTPEETTPEGTTTPETPEETAPEGTTPSGTPGEETTPEGTTPSGAPGEETTPEGTTPSGTPGETTPEGTTTPETPEETAPDGTTSPETPEETTPEESTEETTPEESAEEETDPVTELVYEGEGFCVVVTALEDVDLSGIELHAAPTETEKAAELIYEAKPGMDVAGILAYEISFIYEETGEAADLSGQAAITIEYTAPELEEGLAEEATLAMFSMTDESVSELTEAEGTVLGDGTAEVLADNCDLYALAWLTQQEQTYDGTWEDDQVVIHVTAGAGVIPEGAELSVIPIVKTEEEQMEDLSQEQKAEAEAVNEQYALTEQKLIEDSEANGVLMEGFLAYDISFLVNGEEVEPSGDVKVVMDFKEAAIPEGVSEDAAVAVKHLKEDETAEDGVVVEDMAERADVQTTDKAAVEKVELTSDSFSTFLIYWGNSNDRYVTIHYVNTSGAEITVEGTKNEKVDSGDWVDLSKYAIEIDNCTYQEAHLNSYNGKSVEEIKCDKGRWYYRNSSSGDERPWDARGARHVYLVYEQEIKVHFVSGADGHNLREPMSLDGFFSEYGNGETADLAPAIDGYRFVKTMIAGVYNQYEGTTNDNVYWALRLQRSNNQYQYNRARTDTAGDDRWIEIDNQVYFIYKPDTFQITTRDSSSDGITLNLFNYDNSIKTAGEAAGFPFYNGKTNHVDGSTGSSNTGGDVTDTLGADGYPVATANDGSLAFLFGQNAMSANYLFSYDASSYSYEYDSQRNHAYYDEDEKRFYVYDYTLSPADTSDSHYADFEVGNFFPFNDTINPQKGRLNYIQYGREQRTNVDYWFGMSMNMNFYQPENGVLSNGDAMRFEFRGDDDVFVYLDGVLILDLGGIHAAESGTIDFSTGTIEENGKTIYNGIYERYMDSGLFTTEQLAEMFTEITVSGRTSHIFADYKNVDMDFFYLERGAGASNCHIKFNMPPIPDDTIIVGKQITDANASVYSDVEFSFKLETKAEGASDYTTVENTRVEVYDSSGVLVDDAREVDENGVFKLKHGERAYFRNYPVTTQYRVSELGVSSAEYDNVTIAGVMVSQISSSGATTEREDWRTEELTVAQTPMVVFRNRIASQNKRELKITKEIAANDNDATYQVQVYLGDDATDETGTPYAGSYWIDNKEYTATNGIISLQKGQTASIVHIPSGTSFKVVEVNLNSDTYVDPKYAVEYADTPGTDGAATGKLVLNKDALVTVTNALQGVPDTPYIEVQKIFEGLDNNELPSGFAINLYRGSNGTDKVATLTLDDGNESTGPTSVSENGLTFTWRLDNLEAGMYYLQETGETVENHTVAIKVNNEPVASGNIIGVTTQSAVYNIFETPEIEEISPGQSISGSTNIIAGSFESNNYLVWTIDTLSAGERQAIVTEIGKMDGFENIATNNTVFFSTMQRIKDGINYRSYGTVSITEAEGDTNLNFTEPSKWLQLYCGQYEKTGTVNAEIEVINSYTEKKTPIDLIKYGSSFSGKTLEDAVFSLYEGTLKGNDIEWGTDPVEEFKQIKVSSSGDPELNLQSGYYILKEIAAPDNYQLLDENIYFKVENGNVSLINGTTGAELDESSLPDMWEVSTDNGIKIKIKNNILYDLPSAGGPGIYLYMLGGALLLMSGALMVYNERKKEVSGS